MDAQLKEEILELLKGDKKDSLTIGNSKTGEVKVYFNADNLEEADRLVFNAISLLLSHRKKVLGE